MTLIFNLRKGAGRGNPKDGLCLMQMVDYFSGRDRQISDHPRCACPVLTCFCIFVNDCAPSQAARDELWPLVWQLGMWSAMPPVLRGRC